MLLRRAVTAWRILRSHRLGWRSDRHIVVLESDDWGGIRTASRAAYERLTAAGYPMDLSPYSLDALETNEDLEALFDVLQSVRDVQGRPACMTANMVTANPDFEKIRREGFQQYAWEPAARTLTHLPGRDAVADLWAQGDQAGLFHPQLHGREHVRFWDWIKALEAHQPEARETFDLGMAGVPLAASKEARGFFGSLTLDEKDLADCDTDIDEIIRDGVRLFEQQFGYRSQSVIAANYRWNDLVERIWSALGVKYIQGTVFQRLAGNASRDHFLGERGVFGAVYLVRNCHFEPTAAKRHTCGRRTLRQVARAFARRQPAIICSHRVNYVGSICPTNRRLGLEQLAQLLTAIVRRWPDVMFLNSPELGQRIQASDKTGGPDSIHHGPT